MQACISFFIIFVKFIHEVVEKFLQRVVHSQTHRTGHNKAHTSQTQTHNTLHQDNASQNSGQGQVQV